MESVSGSPVRRKTSAKNFSVVIPPPAVRTFPTPAPVDAEAAPDEDTVAADGESKRTKGKAASKKWDPDATEKLMSLGYEALCRPNDTTDWSNDWSIARFAEAMVEFFPGRSPTAIVQKFAKENPKRMKSEFELRRVVEFVS